MREKRKSGENDSMISKIIRNDFVVEFIQYMNVNNLFCCLNQEECF